MELLLNYLLKSGLCMLALYLFYYGLLRTQTNFRFNRLFLLLSPLVALVLPLVKWPNTLSTNGVVSEALQSIQLSEVIVTAYRPAAATAISEPTFSIANALTILYTLGVLFLLFRLGRQLWQVRQLKAKATACHLAHKKVEVYELNTPYPTFAFGNAIFLSKQPHLNTADQDKIMAHELAHVKLLHTWDILYFELLSSLLWFNPIVWLIKQELRDVHEYQADASVLSNYNPQDYSDLLSREVLQQIGLPIGSYFQKPQVLKRLHMLQQNGMHSSWARPLLALPVLGCLLFIFSIQQVDAQASDLNKVKELSASEDHQPERMEKTDLTVSVTLEHSNKENDTKTVQPKALPKELIAQEESVAPTFKETKKEDQPASDTESKPYTYVQQMPQFEGGDMELMRFLARNIRYPKDAQEKGIEGVVMVGFVVKENGALHDLKILKPVEESVDIEALRVVSKMDGLWSPGKQNGTAVSVRYTLPVRFVLN